LAYLGYCMMCSYGVLVVYIARSHFAVLSLFLCPASTSAKPCVNYSHALNIFLFRRPIVVLYLIYFAKKKCYERWGLCSRVRMGHYK